MSQNDIEKRLNSYIDPYTGQGLAASNAIKQLNVTEDSVFLTVEFGYPLEFVLEQQGQAISECLAPALGDRQLNIKLTSKVASHVGRQGMQGLAGIKNIIAVASGKGGVGKSTVAVNLALALSGQGASVGLLDADIYGPSQPTMLNTQGKKPPVKDEKFEPVESHGIKSMSMGYLVKDHAPMAWRGPMIGKAMQQMLTDSHWGELDYLIIDLPPGTGDIQLTLCQKVPVSGAVIVTTPQDVALVDVARACEMFTKLSVPMLGVVENMSMHTCQNCGHQEHVFGQGGADKLASDFGLDMLQRIPLDLTIREQTDSGEPPALRQSEQSRLFHELALRVAGRLSLQPKDYSSRFGKVVVKNDDN